MMNTSSSKDRHNSTGQQKTPLKPTYKYKKHPNELRAKSVFLGTMRYKAAVPSMPLEPKQAMVPVDLDKIVEHSTTSLDKAYKFQLFTEPHMGIPIDLIDSSIYETPHDVEHHPDDVDLLADTEEMTAEDRYTSSDSVTWLRKAHTPGQLAAGEGPMGRRRVSKTEMAQKMPPSVDQVLEHIEASFERAAELDLHVVHPTNPHLTAEAVYAVYPNFDLWSNIYLDAVFERADPLAGRPDKDDKFYGALIHTDKDGGDQDKQNAVYLVPKEKFEAGQEGTLEYDHVKSYRVELGERPEDAFVLELRDGKAFYNRIAHKMILETKLQKNAAIPSHISVTMRGLNSTERNRRAKAAEELEY